MPKKRKLPNQKNFDPDKIEQQDPMISGFGGHYGRMSEFAPKKKAPKKRSARRPS